uniref:Uncharacterized protein n=1 Tax=Scophthalmus maximus TaxID=52904 RepID=A0A8D3CFR8_SCOMX
TFLRSSTDRDTPEEDLKPDDYQRFKNLGSACLTGGDDAQLLKFLQDEKNQADRLLRFSMALKSVCRLHNAFILKVHPFPGISKYFTEDNVTLLLLFLLIGKIQTC